MNAARFDLPPTGLANPPAFLTATACQDWLVTVPLANPTQAQAQFLRQLTLLNAYTLPPAERLTLLELIRGALTDMQDDVAKRFAAKPLPLSPPEQAAFDGTLMTWQCFAAGYLRCFEACLAGDPAIQPHAARVAQRVLTVFADWQVDLCRGQQLPDAAYWQMLHRVFVAAESLGVATAPVDDLFRHGSSTQTSALAAYAECALLHMAAPFELPPRHVAWIARWAKRWSGKVGLLAAAPAAAPGHALPLFVDIAGERPPGYAARDAATPRWLETTDLRKSLKNRLLLLEKGEPPSKLHLGEDCTQPAAGQLLQRVYQRWCKGGAERRHERRPASGRCEFVIGFDAAHYHLSGRQPFRPPTTDQTMLRKEREQMATFGTVGHRAASAEEQNFQVESGQMMDDWQLLDTSAAGLRIQRPLKEGQRIGTGQIVAVHTAGGSSYVLGNVRWALREGDTLTAGIQLFPGKPDAVAARPAGAGPDPFRQAFLLPEIAPLHEPATVIMHSGHFRIGRLIEIHADGIRKIKLTRMVDRGLEFERAAYEAA